MLTRHLLFALLALVAVAGPRAALGQERARHYGDVRAGLGYYGGERVENFGDPFREFQEASRPGFGFEIGRPLSEHATAGVFYLPGRFPYILRTERGGRFAPIRNGESSDWIHMLGLIGRWRPVDIGRFTPYLQGGAAGTFALLNGDLRVGVGPRIGLGVETQLRHGMLLFAEADGLLVFPNSAMDLAAGNGPHDLFTFAGFGLRYQFGTVRAPAAPRLRDLHGSRRLTPGETGYFAADVDPGDAAEEPVYTWTFGDGNTANGRFATHIYTTPGTYTVTFTVLLDDVALRETLTTVVTAAVLAPEASALLTAPLLPNAREPVRFEPTLTGTSPLTCVWDFGDGSTALGCTPEHTYMLPGTYTVTLEVINPGGRVQRSRPLEVRGNPCAEPPALAEVYFDVNSAHLSVEARQVLRENIDALSRCPSLTVEVSGYTTPGERNEARLATERAEAVVTYYRNMGVDRARLHPVGRGRHPDIEPGFARWQYRAVTSRLVAP